MVIAGVLVKTEVGRGEEVLEKLKRVEGVTTYGLHKEINIVTVVEGETAQEARRITEEMGKLDGVLGAFPVYISFEG